MSRKLALVMTSIIIMGILGVVLKVYRVEASGTIYIRTNGSIDPLNVPISTIDNVTYIFTGNINDSVVIERSNIIIDGNGHTIQNKGSTDGFRLYSISNVTIKNTRIIGFAYSIHLFYSSNNTITGNNITEDQGTGIYLYSSSENNIYRNNITGNLLYGIYLYSSSNNNVSGNNIENNGFDGVILRSSCNNIINGNNITANYENGIFFDYSSNNNSISENNITNNSRGIRIVSSNYNSIIENNIAANTEDGIWLGGCQNKNSIIKNNVTNNNCGIRLLYSSNISFFHNNFVDNSQQAFIETPGYANFWDDGFPSGGNYWSDYTERYPNATEIYDSGIWNTPYVIDANNEDSYPIIPEFPQFMIVPLFMIATLLTAIIYKVKCMQTEAKEMMIDAI
jgi:parallel beta-helix repeat protein